MGEALGVLEPLVEAARPQFRLNLGQGTRRSAPAGHRIDDQGEFAHRMIMPNRAWYACPAHGTQPRSPTSSPPPSGGIARGRPHVAARPAPREDTEIETPRSDNAAARRPHR